MPDQQITYFPLAGEYHDFSDEEREILSGFNSRIATCQSLGEAMDMVWDTTTGMVPHDRIGLSFIERDGQTVSAAWCRAAYADTKLCNSYSSGLAHSSLKPILEEGKCRILNDLESYLKAHAHSGSTRLLVEEGVRSSLTLPLIAGGRPVGFLFYSSRHAHAFTPHHAQFLMGLLSVMPAIIEKARTIEMLRKANADYATLLGFVAHEMKSPLSTMTTLGYTYLDGYLGPVDPLARDTVGKMLRISGYLVNMIGNYLGLSQLESGQMRFQPQEDVAFVADILGFVTEALDARIRERGATMHFDGNPEEIYLTADPELLKIVLINLTDNAVKYGKEGGNVHIRYRLEEKKLIFTIQNEGVGFTKEQASGLFKRFSRLKQKGLEDRKGTGLGLYLTWWVIQKHEGRIWAESEPGQWARFSFELPGASKIKLNMA